MPDELWTTSAALAAAFRATPVVDRVCRPLVSNDFGTPPVNFIEHDNKNGALWVIFHQYLHSHPLLLGVRLAELGIYELGQPPPARAWLDDAVAVAQAFQTMIELLRSRLPGYPMLRVPHLRRGSPRLFDGAIQFTGFPWDSELRRSGLHLRTPPTFAQLGGDHLACRSLVLDTGRCLERRPAWQRFADARRALSDADAHQLTELGKQFAARTKPSALEEVLGASNTEQFEQREAILHDVVASAEGAVGEYLAAFEAVDELIDVIACHLQTLALAGELPVADPYRMDLGPDDGDLRSVELAAHRISLPFGSTDAFYVRGPLPQLSGIVYPLDILTPDYIPPEYRDEDEDEPPRWVVVNGKLASGSG
jgi:hypothetical protein